MGHGGASNQQRERLLSEGGRVSQLSSSQGLELAQVAQGGRDLLQCIDVQAQAREVGAPTKH